MWVPAAHPFLGDHTIHPPARGMENPFKFFVSLSHLKRVPNLNLAWNKLTVWT